MVETRETPERRQPTEARHQNNSINRSIESHQSLDIGPLPNRIKSNQGLLGRYPRASTLLLHTPKPAHCRLTPDVNRLNIQPSNKARFELHQLVESNQDTLTSSQKGSFWTTQRAHVLLTTLAFKRDSSIGSLTNRTRDQNQI